MERKVLLGVLILLASLRVVVAEAVEGPCCDWTENAEWPLEASQCPATLDGPNTTYCCGLCYASHHCPLEEVWLGQDECPKEEPVLVASGSVSNDGFWGSALTLIFPAVFLLLFFCAWLWLKDDHRGPAEDSPDPVSGSSSSFVHSQLCSRYLPPCYGACSTAAGLKSTMSTLEPQDSPSLSGDTRVQFYQPAGEDEVILSPLTVLTASGGAPETAPGGAPETAPGDAPETAPGGAPETAPGGAPETAPGGAPETASGGAPETASGGAPETASPTE